MSGPPGEGRAVPAYVALARIGTVVAMSAAAAFGLFLIIGGWWQAGLISIALALPFFVLMRVVEGSSHRPEPPEAD